MKKIWILLFCLWTIQGTAQTVNRGIEFFHGSWDEVQAKARVENKLIFIDFYTQWCGPCLAMTEDVFPLSFIGEFYNSHFVNCKIDAESGEGVALAKRYGVQSYPTYVFVDPADGSVVHRSKSRQSAEQFLATGSAALEPELRSDYLQDQFTKGRRDKAFLIHYIQYNASIYEREKVETAFDLLMDNGGKLTDPELWQIFDQNITGWQNKYLDQVARNYDEYVKILGKKAVDGKLYKETRYCPVDRLNGMPEFVGKKLNQQMTCINELIRERSYDEADHLIRATMADTSINQQDYIDQLKFTVRSSSWGEETPVVWLSNCVSYLQYIAYNNLDRQDAYIHQEYAAMLERLIRLTPGAEKTFPGSVMKTSEVGAKEYNMRPRNLIPKPVRKKK